MKVAGAVSQNLRFAAGCIAVFLCASAAGQSLDAIGVTKLRLLNPALTGTGVLVAQVEAGGSAFEVNPAAVNQPTSLFTWHSAAGSSNEFPNTVGTESGHANTVGNYFYGAATPSSEGGVAPGVSHVDSYEAGYFFRDFIVEGAATPARIVNQSFIFNGGDIAEVNQVYDDYAAFYNTIFVSGVGNGGSPSSPGTMYNGIGVGAFTGATSIGPTSNGRSKPDIVAPATFTSYSTPQVAGAAAILVQAAGSNLEAADARTVKALLLNGATKPAGWTHSPTAPLDTRYGAGVLDVFESYLDLAAGKHAPNVQNGSENPSTSTVQNSLRGWDFRSLTTVSQPRVAHYAFDLTGEEGVTFTLTSTLAWNKAVNATGARDLDLLLYSAAGALIDSSITAADNVEHLFTQGLLPGRYDLQVVKRREFPQTESTETYSLVFRFAAVPEPGTGALMLIGVLILAKRTRGRRHSAR